MRKQIDERKSLILKDVGSVIRELRLAKDISEGEFAKLCRTDVMTISEIELGTRNMTMVSFLTICEELGIHPQYIFGMRNKDSVDDLIEMLILSIERSKKLDPNKVFIPEKERATRKNDDKK